MAQHKSAKKRALQSLKRAERNRRIRSSMRTEVKRFRSALEASDPSAADKLRRAESAIRRAVSKGVVPARRASRSVSRLNRAFNAASSS